MPATINGTTGFGGNLTGNVTGNVTGTSSAVADGAVSAAKLDGAQSGSAPVYGCRAWVNFAGATNTSGTADATNTNRFIRASGNVASVSRTAQGIYVVTFTTAMPDANYSVSITADDPSGGSSGVLLSSTASSFAVGALRVTPTAYVDMNVITCAVFR